jgi:RNA polymerase sigma factor for flagellar operon FliA
MELALDRNEVESRVRSLAPLVKRIAKHIAASVPTSVDQARLVQAGMNGLLDAARRYNGESGREFDGFAVPLIRREMIDSLQGSTSLAGDTRRKMRDAETAMERLERRKKRPPTDREVAEALGTSLEDYHELLRGAQGYQIISYEDCDPESGDDPLQALNDPEMREVVVEAIDTLPERERLVMSLYHEHQLNHAEIGAVIGVSESRASEMYTQAIARIRVAIRGAELLAR